MNHGAHEPESAPSAVRPYLQGFGEPAPEAAAPPDAEPIE